MLQDLRPLHLVSMQFYGSKLNSSSEYFILYVVLWDLWPLCHMKLMAVDSFRFVALGPLASSFCENSIEF